MKKTLLTGLAVVAVLAFASTAGAVTCTVDQHPAATLLVPWFQVSVDSAGDVVGTGPGARDTLVTIGNASSAPMIAHVNVFNEHSELVLDFNIALTGFDIQSFAMSSIITGTLPQTGWFNSSGVLQDACQRNPSAKTYSESPAGIGFIRFRPPAPTDSNDNVLATTLYPVPAWTKSSAFYMQVLDSLDNTFDTNTCPNFDGVDGVLAGLEHGYLVIDHANYCNLSNPSQDAYYYNDAIGNENNLFGDIIFTSGIGLPTYAMSTVNLEADSSFGIPQTDVARFRSFYARYWSPSAEFAGGFNPANCAGADSGHQHLHRRALGHRLRRSARAPGPQLRGPLVRHELALHHDELPRVARRLRQPDRPPRPRDLLGPQVHGYRAGRDPVLL